VPKLQSAPRYSNPHTRNTARRKKRKSVSSKKSTTTIRINLIIKNSKKEAKNTPGQKQKDYTAKRNKQAKHTSRPTKKAGTIKEKLKKRIRFQHLNSCPSEKRGK